MLSNYMGDLDLSGLDIQGDAVNIPADRLIGGAGTALPDGAWDGDDFGPPGVVCVIRFIYCATCARPCGCPSKSTAPSLHTLRSLP